LARTPVASGVQRCVSLFVCRGRSSRFGLSPRLFRSLSGGSVSRRMSVACAKQSDGVVKKAWILGKVWILGSAIVPWPFLRVPLRPLRLKRLGSGFEFLLVPCCQPAVVGDL